MKPTGPSTASRAWGNAWVRHPCRWSVTNPCRETTCLHCPPSTCMATTGRSPNLPLLPRTTLLTCPLPLRNKSASLSTCRMNLTGKQIREIMWELLITSIFRSRRHQVNYDVNTSVSALEDCFTAQDHGCALWTVLMYSTKCVQFYSRTTTTPTCLFYTMQRSDTHSSFQPNQHLIVSLHVRLFNCHFVRVCYVSRA